MAQSPASLSDHRRRWAGRLSRPYGTLHRQPHSAGFTLIELVVVMAIISLITGFALLSMGLTSRDSAEAEAERFRLAVRFAVDEARMLPGDLGLGFYTDGYHFLLWQGEQWQTLERGRWLRPHRLAAAVTMSVEVEGEQAPIHDQGERSLPQALFLSAGEVTALTAHFSNSDSGEHYLSRLDAAGRVDKVVRGGR